MKQLKILICVPCFENIEPDCFKSIYGLQTPTNCSIQFDFIRGYDCARARNLIAQTAIDYNFDYVLMVDSDIVLPSHTLVSLLSHNKDIVYGWMRRKRTRTEQTEIFKLGYINFTDENNYSVNEINDLKCITEIKGGGMGCSLIATQVFKDIPEKWFQYIEYTSGDVLSEDNFFATLCTKYNKKIFLDPSVHCGHINKFII